MKASAILSSLLFCWFLIAAPTPSQASEQASEQAALDPVVTAVIEMLQGNVAETIILRWLPTVPGPDATLSSQELVALSRAGASEALLSTLLDKSIAAEPAAGSSEDQETAPARAAQAPFEDKPSERLNTKEAAAPKQPALPAPKLALKPAPAPVPAAPREAGAPSPSREASRAPVRFRIDYFPAFEEEEDPWDLYLYLDGEALAGVTGGRKQRGSLVVEKKLAPGRHHLLVLQERHQKRKRSQDGWFHEARLWPETLSFEVPAGSPVEVSLEFLQPQFNFRPTGPLTWAASVDGKAIAGADQTGPAPEDWQPLCEEVEANIPPGEKGPIELRQKLKRCVRWADVWPSKSTTLPSRSDLRADLQAVEFEPSRVTDKP